MVGMRRSVLVLAAALAVGLPGAAATGAAAVSADVYLLQGEGLRAVPRQLPQRTVALAVGALLRGPTAAETKADVRSQIPTGTRLRSAPVKSGVATIDL